MPVRQLTPVQANLLAILADHNQVTLHMISLNQGGQVIGPVPMIIVRAGFMGYPGVRRGFQLGWPGIRQFLDAAWELFAAELNGARVAETAG